MSCFRKVMSESDAKEKVCPLADHKTCKGSGCMAWNFLDNAPNRIDLPIDDSDGPDGYEAEGIIETSHREPSKSFWGGTVEVRSQRSVWREKTDMGYCSLMGNKD